MGAVYNRIKKYMKMKISPIKRHNLPGEVIKQIQKIIIDGNLKTEDKLPPERELAQNFQVGRTTIREALKALSFAKVIIRTKEALLLIKMRLIIFLVPLMKNYNC